MIKMLRLNDPPVSYNFMVALAPSTTPSSMLGAVALASLVFDAAFTQISGLGVQLNYTPVRSGGYNNEVYHLPGGVNRGALTLKRGLASFASPLMQWCLGTASGSNFIEPKTIVVMLQDKNPNYPPVMTWMLYNAIPVKWEIDELDAKKSDIVIESIEIVFSNMDVVGTSWFSTKSSYLISLKYMPVEIKQLMVKGIMEDANQPSRESATPRMAKEEGGNLTYSAKKQLIDECVHEVMERIKKMNEL